MRYSSCNEKDHANQQRSAGVLAPETQKPKNTPNRENEKRDYRTRTVTRGTVHRKRNGKLRSRSEPRTSLTRRGPNSQPAERSPGRAAPDRLRAKYTAQTRRPTRSAITRDAVSHRQTQTRTTLQYRSMSVSTNKHKRDRGGQSRSRAVDPRHQRGGVAILTTAAHGAAHAHQLHQRQWRVSARGAVAADARRAGAPESGANEAASPPSPQPMRRPTPPRSAHQADRPMAGRRRTHKRRRASRARRPSRPRRRSPRGGRWQGAGTRKRDRRPRRRARSTR